MDEEQQVNVLKIYSRVNELLLLDEKYCDVTISIGDQSFTSSRLLLASISEFFNAMFFGSNFVGKNYSKAEPIEIHNIDAVAFKQILQFMNSGDISITDGNVYPLLFASDFLRLRIPFIDEQCTRYLQDCISKTKRILNALKILAFACTTKKTTLIDLMSKHICEHLSYFAEDGKFLNISFDELNSILKYRYWPSSRINDTTLLNAVSRWVNHSRKERNKFRQSLMENVDLTKVSGQYLAFMFNRYEHFMDQFESIETAEPDHKMDCCEFFRGCPSLATNFHIIAFHKTSAQIGVFSVNDSESISLSCEIPSRALIRQSTVVRDTLYCLSCCDNMNTQIFSASKSVNALPDSTLENPPRILSQFSICGFENSIFAYDASKFNYTRGSSYDKFSDGERSRSVYVYNCELNKWFSVPPMKNKVFSASMTIDHNLLYLIGGKSICGGSSYKYMQIYDHRMKMWSEVSICVPYINSSCCAHQGKIYVSNTDCKGHTTDLDVYDPLAGDWSCAWKSKAFLGQGIDSIKLASRKSELWMISTCKNLNVGVYDTAPEAERTRSFSLRNLVCEEYSHFIDSVVF